MFYAYIELEKARIEEIKQELCVLEAQPRTPIIQKQIDGLERDLTNCYESIEDYKSKIVNYDYEHRNDEGGDYYDEYCY